MHSYLKSVRSRSAVKSQGYSLSQVVGSRFSTSSPSDASSHRGSLHNGDATGDGELFYPYSADSLGLDDYAGPDLNHGDNKISLRINTPNGHPDPPVARARSKSGATYRTGSYADSNTVQTNDYSSSSQDGEDLKPSSRIPALLDDGGSGQRFSVPAEVIRAHGRLWFSLPSLQHSHVARDTSLPIASPLRRTNSGHRILALPSGAGDTADRVISLDAEEGQSESSQSSEQPLPRPPEHLKKRKRKKKLSLATSPDRKPISNLRRLTELPSQLSAACRKLVYWEWFDRILLCLIMINCIFLALDSPTASPQLKRVLMDVDTVFVILYTIEMVIKLIGLGVVRQADSYFRSYWNWLDFIVVIEGLVSLIWLSGGSSISILRFVRAFRPLRTVKHLQGLKLITSALFRSIPMLLSTFVVIVFYLFIFGIVGVELFRGVLRQQCVDEATGEPLGLERPCGGEFECPAGSTCKKLDYNINGEYNNFDTFPEALNVISESITLEGWSSMMYLIQDAAGAEAWIYFVALVLFGAFILVNLLLAVVMARFREASEEMARSRWQKQQDAMLKESWRRAYRDRLKRVLSESPPKLGFSSVMQAGTTPSHNQPAAAAFSLTDEEARELQMNPIGAHAGLKGGGRSKDSSVADADSPAETRRPWWTCSGCLLRVEEMTCRRVCRCCRQAYAKRIGSPLRAFMENKVVVASIMACVVVNTIALAMYHYGMSEDLTNVLDILNLVFVSVFAAEMALKLLAYGFAGYVADNYNILDGIIVIISLVELGLSGSSALSVFRMGRIFRIIRLLRQFKGLQHILRIIKDTLPQFGSLALLLGIFLFVYTILGMQLLGGILPSDLDFSFATFHHSLLTVFQVLTGEGWDGVMQDTLLYASSWARLYFYSWVIIGQFLILNLALAILLSAFENDDGVQEQRLQDEEEVRSILAAKEQRRLRRRVQKARRLSMSMISPPAGLHFQMPEEGVDLPSEGGNDAVVLEEVHKGTAAGVSSDGNEDSKGEATAKPDTSTQVDDGSSKPGLNGGGKEEEEEEEERIVHATSTIDSSVSGIPREASGVSLPNYRVRGRTWCCCSRKMSKCCFFCGDVPPRVLERLKRQKLLKDPFAVYSDTEAIWTDEGNGAGSDQGMGCPKCCNCKFRRSLGCIPRGSPLQEACDIITTQRQPLFSFVCCNRTARIPFDTIVMVLIVISSLMLALENPHDGSDKLFFRVADIIFTSIFAIEIVFRLIATGFVFHKNSFLRSGYNVIDLIVVLSAAISIVVVEFGLNLSAVRILRLLRFLRPLRLVSRNAGLRQVVESLLSSFGAISHVMFVLFLVWGMFAVLGVQLFSGSLRDCADPSFPPDTSFDGGVDPFNASHTIPPCSEVVNPGMNFDNVFVGFQTLFITASGEGWPDIMRRTNDITGVDRSPAPDSSPWGPYYFIIFTCLGAFFLLNLFLAVIFEKFMELKRRKDGSLALTDRQRDWVEAQLRLSRAKCPKPVFSPPQRWRKVCFAIVRHSAFDGFITLCIALNILSMTVVHEGMSEELTQMLDISNLVFTVIFTVEAAIKICGFGWSQYFGNLWNRFDFFIVLISLVDLLIAFMNVGFFRVLRVSRVFPRIVRILRLTRGIRLARAIKGLRNLFITVMTALPSLVNVGLLLALVYFIFAVIGVSLFGGMTLDNDTDINDHANFNSFGHALLLLFRMSTGEGYEGVMFTAEDESQGGTEWAPLYFLSFLVITAFILLDLFIMIILEDFESVERQQDGLNDEQLEEFKEVWLRFDPLGTGFVADKYIEDILRALPPPLGISRDAPFSELVEVTTEMKLMSWNGSIAFQELLLAVHRVAYGVSIPEHVLKHIVTAPEKVHKRINRQVVKRVRKHRRMTTLQLQTDELRKLRAEMAGEPTPPSPPAAALPVLHVASPDKLPRKTIFIDDVVGDGPSFSTRLKPKTSFIDVVQAAHSQAQDKAMEEAATTGNATEGVPRSTSFKQRRGLFGQRSKSKRIASRDLVQSVSLNTVVVSRRIQQVFRDWKARRHTMMAEMPSSRPSMDEKPPASTSQVALELADSLEEEPNEPSSRNLEVANTTTATAV